MSNKRGRLDVDALLAPPPKGQKPTHGAELKSWLNAAEAVEEEKIFECPSARAAQNREQKVDSKWWEIPERKLTPEVKRDLQVIQAREFIDPKRFYKTSKEQRKLPTRFQIGTIVESALEGRRGRLTNKERQSSLAKELLVDESFKEYGNKFVAALSEKRGAGKQALKERKKVRRRFKRH